MRPTLMDEVGRLVEGVVRDALPPEAGRAVAREAAEAVEPVLRHAANDEPWWRSRVTWGAIVSLATPALALLGWELGEADREAIVGAIVALGPAIGAALTLYGRWVAARPLGA